MKIAQLSSHYRPVVGGQEVYIHNLNGVLSERGYENIVYQLNRGESADDNVCLPKVPYLAKFITEFETRSLSYLIGLLKPKGLFNADVLIAHYGSVGRSLEKVANKTIILSHGVEWRTENQRPYDKWREENATWCLDRYTHVVNDTYYLRYLGLDIEPAKDFFTEVAPGKWFIPNCVDHDLFSPVEGLAEFKGRKIILVPRQMVEDRGIHLAIDAFARVAKEHPDYEMCLLGKRWKGGSKYLDKLDKMIDDYGLGDRVFFKDPVANSEMPAYYCGSCVTLIPTLRREGTSLSALESMSCGVATVSTNVVGLADLPTYQCDADTESLAEALLETISRKSEIALEQQEIVLKTFNMKNWSECWLKVIDSVAKGNKV